MQAKPYDCVSALSDPFTDDVMVQVIDGAASSAELKIFSGRCSLHLVNLRFVKRVSIVSGGILLRLLLFFVFFYSASFGTSLSGLGRSLTLVQL